MKQSDKLDRLYMEAYRSVMEEFLKVLLETKGLMADQIALVLSKKGRKA